MEFYTINVTDCGKAYTLQLFKNGELDMVGEFIFRNKATLFDFIEDFSDTHEVDAIYGI